MREIDTFATLLLEEAKCFLARAEDSDDESVMNASLHAAFLLAFCSLEAHVNAVASEFAEHSKLAEEDKSVLLEQEMRLDNGVFHLSGLKMIPIHERILFLHNRFGVKAPDRKAAWWSELNTAIKLRNELTHPKTVPSITVEVVARAIQAVIYTLDALFRALYKSEFPSANLGLKSVIAC